MKSLIVVRHCEAAGQDREAPLTADGLAQTEQLTKFFINRNDSVSKIISSPYKRALQTIQPLAQYLQKNIIKDERLSERVLSPIPLDNWMELLEKSFENLDFSIEGGESNRQAFQRVAPLIRRELESEESTVVFVTHGNLMTCILKYFDPRIGFQDWKSLSNPDVFEITFCSKGATLKRIWNEQVVCN